MSFSAQLWNDCYEDALASLYNPFVMGLATGILPQASFVEYIQQDSYYLDVYEKAYLKAAELSAQAGNAEYEKYFSDMIGGIKEEKAKHQQRAVERGEKIEQPGILRATKGYTDLLTKAYTEGTLAEIAAAICPCSKLYCFIGQEIKKAIPDHHHTYSEWIDTYSAESAIERNAVLEKIIDEVVTDENRESLTFYYREAMRLEFEFFDQQSHMPTIAPAAINTIAHGNVKCYSGEVECSHEKDGKVDKDGLIAFVQNLPARDAKECSLREAKVARMREFGADYFKKNIELSEVKEEELTLAYGSFTDLPALLKATVAVLVAPSASEVKAVESYGLKVRRLLTCAAFSTDDLPKDTVFFVEDVFELGMLLMGPAYYPNQHFDTLPTALIIAGSDSGGGAGMQADMKACAALGVFTTTAFTAITAQNTQWCTEVFMLPLDIIGKQIDEVMRDFRIDCVKTGMLGSKEVAHLVAEKLKEHKVKTLVVDPCMICRSGHRIMDDITVPVVKSELIPLAMLITPNYFEAKTLLERDIPHTKEGLVEACRDLQKLGCENVYLKGGRVEGSENALDVFCYGPEGNYELFEVPHIRTRNTHGTGCTLASSIAAGLAKGLSALEAVKEAKDYVNGAVLASRYLHVGKGKQGPVNHLYRVFPCRQH